VEDGETGFWFRSGDPDALAAHLRRLQDDATADRMGRAAHARYWAAPLSRDAHLDRLTGVYETVMREAALGRSRSGAASRSRAVAPA
jgi:glycosyltransferase involved in cell wall biosynthesis